MRQRFMEIPIALVLGLSALWLGSGPISVRGDGTFIGGFCIAGNKCDSTGQNYDCVDQNGKACGATHDECLGGGEESSKTCSVGTKNCKDTAGCMDHADCTCG
jgi:hypothetical protein